MSLFDSASLVVTPNGVKEGKLYSIKPTDGSGDLSVTRATTATRVNSAGLIEVVPYNLVTYSNTFSNSDWVKGSTITLTGSQTGYDGSNNAWLLSKGAIQYPAIGQSVSNSGTKTLSVYAKANTNTKICLFASSSPSNFYQDFDLSNGTLGPNSFGVVSTLIENVGNGWYRCSVVFNGTTTDFSIFPDDILGANAGSVYIQNAQIVSGSVAKDYYPTTTRLNIPRLDYTNGSCPSILVEPQRTNIYPYSNQLSQWTKSGTITITENNAISPDGTNNANRVQFTANSNLLFLSGTGLSGSNTLTIYAKAKNGVSAKFRFFANGATLFSSDQTATGEWQRFTFTYTYSALTAGLAGPTTGADDVLFYGFQHEIGSYATSYIPTTSASVTRNADVISKTGISSLIGQTEGTIFIDFNVNDLQIQTIDPVIFSTSGTNYVRLFTTGVISYFESNTVPIVSASNVINNGRNKIAVNYKNNDFSLYVNGALVGSNNSGSVVAKSGFGLNYLPNALFDPRLFYNSIVFFPTKLNGAESINLTTL
jgi:hypothetical protein